MDRDLANGGRPTDKGDGYLCAQGSCCSGRVRVYGAPSKTLVAEYKSGAKSVLLTALDVARLGRVAGDSFALVVPTDAAVVIALIMMWQQRLM